MTEIKHAAEVVVPDDPDFPVGSDEWNAAHTVDIDAADVAIADPAAAGYEASDVQGALDAQVTSNTLLFDHRNNDPGSSPFHASAGISTPPITAASWVFEGDEVETQLEEALGGISQAIGQHQQHRTADGVGGTGSLIGFTEHNAAAVGVNDPNGKFTADDVEEALEEVHDLAADHIADSSAAHAASAISFTPNGSIAATDVQAAIQEVRDEAGGGGAPTDVDYLVGTASGGLSAEIVVGTSPGGELGGTWASPTVDATHSGSTHAAATTTHEAASDPHPGYVLESLFDAKGDLISASADNTPAKLTVGADDTILMADSAAASGLKWVASASPSAVGTAAATGTADTFTRGDHVHAHEAAHVAHDTIWDAANDYVRGSGADTGTRQAASAATPAAISTSGSTGTAANPPSADDHVHAHEAAHLAHDTLWAAAGDLVKGTGNDTADILTKGADDQVLRSTSSTVAWESPPFSVGITLVGAAPANGNYMVWRAPFPCTLTNVRSHFKGGTNCVVNARRNQTSNGLSSNFTNSTADAWGDGGSVQNTAYAAGDDLELMLVSTSGAVTEVCIQADFTRP